MTQIGEGVAAKKPPAEKPPKSPEGCGIHAMEIECKHKRKIGRMMLLQVVPDTIMEEAVKLGWETPSEDDASLFMSDGPRNMPEMGITFRKKYGGEEEIQVAIKSAQPCTHENTVTKKQCILVSPNAPLASDWTGGELEVYRLKAPPNHDDLWPFPGVPDVYFVAGRGCGDVWQQASIEVFPSQQWSISGSAGLELFNAFADGINRGWDAWGNRLLGHTPFSIDLKIEGAKGTFDASWGWKEDQDWKAFYAIGIKASLNPLIGVKMDVSLSLVAAVGMGFGVPPVIGKFLGKHLADIILTLGGGCKGIVSGEIQGQNYTIGPNKLTGAVKIIVEGSVTLTLKAHLGSDYVVSVSASVGGEAKIIGTNGLELDSREGVFWAPEVTFGGLEVKVVLKTRAFLVLERDKTAKWKVWDEAPLYPPEGAAEPRWKLFPREGGGE